MIVTRTKWSGTQRVYSVRSSPSGTRAASATAAPALNLQLPAPGSCPGFDLTAPVSIRRDQRPLPEARRVAVR